MKLQLLYVFLLAAPLLVHVFSREPASASEAPAAREAVPLESAATPPAQKPEIAPATGKTPQTRDARSRGVPAAHAFTFI